MTAIIDRDVITAAQEPAAEAQALARHGSAAADRRGATRARGVSPRLARSRSQEVADRSITSSNEVSEGAVRTVPGAVRVTGARGAARRTVERPRVRSVGRTRRGVSRVDGCARRTPGPSLAVCLLFAVGTFVGLLVLFGGAQQADPAPAGAAQPALTSIVTVRTGQSLEQIAREIAPDHAPASVIAEIEEINGLRDGRVHAGQTLVTPRY
ncbi:LysM peptidoglycan-binding domain-containing protein [Tsukamurella pseudospumae]|uniref:LysM domain-containing protein n=1 Tax=Tsukamurella pseudospumae TaxID=239498 RepID=A0A138A8V5_9ACTN|nr:LysM peptidoglycan-binding domain-containing protein [Tsukamurella pseudospumae]KXP06830.1 hypothetical protein AXK60_12305 [Tsukamurella pseudospumae]